MVDLFIVLENSPATPFNVGVVNQFMGRQFTTLKWGKGGVFSKT